MTTITVTLPDDQLEMLEDIANRFQVAPEELVRASVEQLLAGPEIEFRRALEHVLNKNAELYRRLA